MRKVPLSKKQKRAEKIKKTLIHVGIWLLGLLIVIALGVFAVRGFGIKTVIAICAAFFSFSLPETVLE